MLTEKNTGTLFLRVTFKTKVVVLLVGLLLAGCARTASRTLAEPTPLAQQIRIEQARVVQGSGVFVSGAAVLPPGACVKTELLADGDAAAWWPADICVEPDGGRWEIVVSLGRSGAPEQLPGGVQYDVRAWWPEKPEEIRAHFPFDLDGPQPPEE